MTVGLNPGSLIVSRFVTPYLWLSFVLSLFQIEDLNQQAQMAAAEKFKAPENPAGAGEGGVQSTISQPIQEESEEEEDVSLLVTDPWESGLESVHVVRANWNIGSGGNMCLIQWDQSAD